MKSRTSKSQTESAEDMQVRLRRLLNEISKPPKVKRIIITRADRFRVRGILLTECPIEKRESGKDFEVVLGENDPNSIYYVAVDGRKFFNIKPKARTNEKEFPAGARFFLV